MSQQPAIPLEDEPWGPAPWDPERTPCRFRNPLSKFRVWRNEAKCIQCGKCVEVCPYGVHTKVGKFIRRPKSYLCVGPTCEKNDFFCVKNCPPRPCRCAFTPPTPRSVTAAGQQICS